MELVKRIITGILFLGIMIGGILYSPYSFITLFVLIAIGCFIEFIKLLNIISKSYEVASFMKFSFSISFIFLPFYMIITSGFHNGNFNNYLILAYFTFIWTNDTMAYVTGKLFGKNKLAPAISAGKTIEGTIGGITFGTLISVGLWYAFTVFQQYQLWHFILLAFFVSVFAVISDLSESKFKRLANVKDSGNLLPGHGGLLDRFDSVLLSAPILYIYVRLISL